MIDNTKNEDLETVCRLLEEEGRSSYSIIPISTSISPGDRIKRAYSLLTAKFEEAVAGGIEPAVYVMGGDPGTGKGTTLQRYLADWKARGFPGNGAIIFLYTLAEIDAYRDGAGLDRNDYAVLSPDPFYAAYGAGRDAADRVPILFVTHAKARRLLAGVPIFDGVEALHYKGNPRSLRVWDEALIPAEYATFELNDLRAIPASLKGRSTAEIRAFEALIPDKADCVSGAVLNVPAAMRETIDGLQGSASKLPVAVKRTLDSLSKLAGSKAILRGPVDGPWQYVGAGLPVPNDMAPLFVLDASARVTNRYRDWRAYGLKVVELEPARVRYTNLAIHHWDIGCGKTALAQPERKRMVFKAIADLANTKPTESFLLVMSKSLAAYASDDRPIIPDELHRLITDPSRVSITTWGRHLSSNEHRSVANVVVVGAYDYGSDAYGAIDLAVTGRVRLNDDDIREGISNERGAEFRHNLLQAVCRINCRNQNDGVCGSASAYLIMEGGGKRQTSIEVTFPGCTIETWRPMVEANPKKWVLVLDAVQALLSDRSIVSREEVRAYCGSKDRSYLTKVIKNPDFVKSLKVAGISITKGGFVKAKTLSIAA